VKKKKITGQNILGLGSYINGKIHILGLGSYINGKIHI
jgi:hypothetical protein